MLVYHTRIVTIIITSQLLLVGYAQVKLKTYLSYRH